VTVTIVRTNIEKRTSSPRDVVQVMAAMFNVDPTLSGKELSERLGLSVSRLARLFKGQMGVSMVEYRNRLRFKRLFALLAVDDGRRPTLRQAVREAGFGSYAHFHRLFRARWHTGPRQGFRNGVALSAEPSAPGGDFWPAGSEQPLEIRLRLVPSVKTGNA